MNILVVTTESHRVLRDRFFLPSLPAGSRVLEKSLDGNGAGDYLSPAWQDGVTAKLRWAAEFARDHPGAVFALSDVDVQFFPGFSWSGLETGFLASRVDVAFQKESARPDSREVNTGFYLARATPAFLELMERAIALCDAARTKNDQVAVNAILDENPSWLAWTTLPLRIYARTHGFPPPRDILVHHANFSHSIVEKIEQLEQVRRMTTGSRLARTRAILRESLRYAASGKLIGSLARKLRRPV